VVETRQIPTRAPDPRPARTRAAIHRAVESLVDAGSPVTVNAILQAAGVSRSAFYAQFADIDELALSLLVEQFHAIGVDDIARRKGDSPDEQQIARQAATRLVEHIDRRRAFYRSSLEWRVSARVHETLAAAFADQVSASMEVMGERVPPEHRDGHTARYIGGGAMALITAWLRDDEPIPPADMAARLLGAMPEWLVGRAENMKEGAGQ
jgi:AcrR family transcriptional regulator